MSDLREKLISGDIPAATPGAMRELLRKHGLTGGDAAAILGVDGRTIRKWIGSERGIPNPVWRLLLIVLGEV